MDLQLPSELLMALGDQIPFRSQQLQYLLALYNKAYSLPRTVVVQGLKDTGKLQTVCAVLAEREIRNAVIRCEECLSQRHLLSKVLSACATGLVDEEELRTWSTQDSRSETVNAVSANLQKLFRPVNDDFVLVIDGIDKARGLSHNTLPALARLGEIIPPFHLILIISTPRPLFIQKAGLPYIQFPPHTRAESIALAIRHPPALAPDDWSPEIEDSELLRQWYALFVTTVYDTLLSVTSTSVQQLKQTSASLWPRFISPFINQETPPGRGENAQWDFSKLLVRQRALFQTIGEDTLAARLVLSGQTSTTEPKSLPSSTAPNTHQSQTQPAPLLSFFPTLLLIASYLASHTSPKLDILLFSRLSSSSRSRTKRGYHRRKLFQSSSKTQPNGLKGPRKTTTKSKAGLENNLNLARGFALERLIAIIRAIHPHGVPRSRSVVDKVNRHLAELERLRLVVQGDGVAQGRNDDGSLEERKWKINVSKEFVEELAGKYEQEGLSGLLREYELTES